MRQKYSQGYEEMDSLVLPGEEASTAEVSYDHRQEILAARGDTVSERGHILREENQWGMGTGGWSRCSRFDGLGEFASLVSKGWLQSKEVKGRVDGAPRIASCAGLRACLQDSRPLEGL